VNLLVADGEAAGQEVFHIHLHVIPRFAGDGFGFTFGPQYENRPDRAELDALAAQLRISV
jgi:histidine triad (HIT) family protein